jgi:hypothetical protein
MKFPRLFQKKVEDFTCLHCGAFVKGNGYTNHCPRCLWAMHVDINPGDRQNPCQGMMEPISLEPHGQEYILIHKCQKCGAIKRNKTSTADDFEEILKLSAKQ